MPTAVRDLSAVRIYTERAMNRLDARRLQHDAEGRCTRTPQCQYCALLALAFAQLRWIQESIEGL